jgi:phosphinothricin acetyltransferase
MPDGCLAAEEAGAGLGVGLACGVARTVRLRAAAPDDAAAIAAIYAPYVAASAASFENEPPDARAMAERIAAGGDLYPWIVAEDDGGALAGYAYASAFRPRPAYRYAVETSVYLSQNQVGAGLGRRLYASLIATLEAQGFAQAIGAITLPNGASVRLHQLLGFVEAGVYRQVGYKLGAWHDVGLWQRSLAAPADPPQEPKPLREQPVIVL